MINFPHASLGSLLNSEVSWFDGVTRVETLIKPVNDARWALLKYWGDNSRVTELRNRLEKAFTDWRINYGKKPLHSEYQDKELDDCLPCVCAGEFTKDYADLLLRLRKERYLPLLDFDSEIGYQCVSALLVLSEATNNRIESTLKAYLEIVRYGQEKEAQQRKIDSNIYKSASRFIATGVKVVTGTQRRQDRYDREDYRRIAKELWKKDPSATISSIIKSPELEPYKRKYSGRDTFRGWLREIDPRSQKDRIGRPRSK